MTDVLQNVAVLAIVVGAIAYVARRVWRRSSSKVSSGCQACSECLEWWNEAPLASDAPSEAKCEHCGPETRGGTSK